MLNRLAVGFLLAGVALQNLGRRQARTLLLLAGVSICSGAVFTGGVLMRSIDSSMAVGFTRLGADMLVVPEGTLTNITAALLTAEECRPNSSEFRTPAIPMWQRLARTAWAITAFGALVAADEIARADLDRIASLGKLNCFMVRRILTKSKLAASSRILVV
jgi:hypothetical protein